MVLRKRKLIDRRLHKKIIGRCQICGEDNPVLLDNHRIVPGSKSGKYSKANTVVLCTSCHRKVHAGQIIIDGWYGSTAGRKLRIIVDGKEDFV